MAATESGVSFRIELPDSDEVRFCFSIPYMSTDYGRFLARLRALGGPVASSSLCRSERGREVPLLRIDPPACGPKHRVLLTCRHHACESTASYVLEGLLLEACAPTRATPALAEQVGFAVVPFVDYDGVLDGDQGKNRRPFDHNRDYGSIREPERPSIYASTGALRTFVAGWAGGRLRAALDLHCPWIRGGRHETIHFVEGPDAGNRARIHRFSGILESLRPGDLAYRRSDNLVWGEEWNTPENALGMRMFSHWAEALPDSPLSATVEIPYANVGDVTVFSDPAREFGRDVASALSRYLTGPL